MDRDEALMDDENRVVEFRGIRKEFPKNRFDITENLKVLAKELDIDIEKFMSKLLLFGITSEFNYDFKPSSSEEIDFIIDYIKEMSKEFTTNEIKLAFEIVLKRQPYLYRD